MNYTSNLSLSKSVEKLKSGRIDPEECINLLCDRIESVEPLIHALLPEPGRRERLIHDVQDLKMKFPSPEQRPALYCVPVGVKDIFRVDGFPTRAGSQLPESLFEGYESSVISVLKKAGAVILGKTATTEFAYFEPGPTCNPWNPEYTPGGSSSGSAAAVACGFTPLALGTQTIGSILRPASFCGVIGFKPSYRRIATDGIIPFSGSADHAGFFTQDLAGVDLAAGILCDKWELAVGLPDRMPVIGVVSGKYLEQAGNEVLQCLEEKISEFERMGCRIVRMDLFTDIDGLNRMHRRMIAAEFAGVHSAWFGEYGDLYRQSSRDLVLEGQLICRDEIETHRKKRSVLRDQVEACKLQNQVDLWLTPSSCTPAVKGLDSTGSPLMNLPWTFMGLPAISVPSGTSSDGLPVGLQFAGSFMQDEILLAWINKLMLIYSE